MKYKPDFARPAAQQLHRVDPRIGWRILDAVDLLCDDPVGLSSPSGFLHPDQYQMYETEIKEAGQHVALRVFFHYMTDEQTILIDEIIVIPIGQN